MIFAMRLDSFQAVSFAAVHDGSGAPDDFERESGELMPVLPESNKFGN